VASEYPSSHESDNCPHCLKLFEIAAINLSILGRNVALFVCPNCGFTRAEDRHEGHRKRRRPILAIERIWKKAMFRMQKKRVFAGGNRI
jgi:predicted RNA-binding Zn-ribbon protein involved in translation (DUF1610 family)